MITTVNLPRKARHSSIRIVTADAELKGDLDLPPMATGLVVIAHGSGISRHSPRNQLVAKVIREAGIGTLLLDLLTEDEERQDLVTSALRFDIKMLAKRLVGTTRWLEKQPMTRGMKLGFFGASTGGGAALVAAAELGDRIAAVVSRGGRPDLAGDTLPRVISPTLLIVGGYDEKVICLNEDAYARLRCEKDFRIVPGATHLFEERGKLEQVAMLSTQWFGNHMGGDS